MFWTLLKAEIFVLLINKYKKESFETNKYWQLKSIQLIERENIELLSISIHLEL